MRARGRRWSVDQLGRLHPPYDRLLQLGRPDYLRIFAGFAKPQIHRDLKGMVSPRKQESTNERLRYPIDAVGAKACVAELDLVI